MTWLGAHQFKVGHPDPLRAAELGQELGQREGEREQRGEEHGAAPAAAFAVARGARLAAYI